MSSKTDRELLVEIQETLGVRAISAGQVTREIDERLRAIENGVTIIEGTIKHFQSTVESNRAKLEGNGRPGIVEDVSHLKLKVAGATKMFWIVAGAAVTEGVALLGLLAWSLVK